LPAPTTVILLTILGDLERKWVLRVQWNLVESDGWVNREERRARGKSEERGTSGKYQGEMEGEREDASPSLSTSP
jgi:hypothetical protein